MLRGSLVLRSHAQPLRTQHRGGNHALVERVVVPPRLRVYVQDTTDSIPSCAAVRPPPEAFISELVGDATRLVTAS